MSQQERWQVRGSAPEIYERYLVPAIFGSWAALVVEEAALQRGERVLDVACGTGVVARLAAPLVGSSGQVTAVDLNPGMLAVARALPPPDGAPVDWRVGDAAALPTPDAAFDVVFCQQGLQFFPDRLGALREMRRAMRSAGRLVLLVWRAIAHSPGYAALAAALERHVSPAAAAVMRAPFVFGDETKDLRELLSAARFGVNRVRPDVRMVRFASTETFLEYQVAASPLAGHLAEKDEAAREALRREVMELMRPYLGEEGIAFPIEAHVVVAHADLR
jgi:ubiquinone/menaquinone biosynthesis C-methylase UbiE